MEVIWVVAIAIVCLIVLVAVAKPGTTSEPTCEPQETTAPVPQSPEDLPSCPPYSQPHQAVSPVQPPAPGWFLPAGIACLMLAILAFLASAALGGGGTVAGALLAGLINPLFFIPMPLGVYWLYCVGQNTNRSYSPPPSQVRPVAARDERQQEKQPHPIADECNPRLTHCPDCGRHVSRLAPSCPHCGRPLTPEIQQAQ